MDVHMRYADIDEHMHRQVCRMRNRYLEIAVAIKRVLTTQESVADDANSPHVALKPGGTPTSTQGENRGGRGRDE